MWTLLSPVREGEDKNSFFIDINVTLTNLLAVLLINDRLKGYSTLHEDCERILENSCLDSH